MTESMEATGLPILHDLNPEAVKAALDQQACDLNPPRPATNSSAHSTTAGIPRFDDGIRAQR
jgi:hypothetical protein